MRTRNVLYVLVGLALFSSLSPPSWRCPSSDTVTATGQFVRHLGAIHRRNDLSDRLERRSARSAADQRGGCSGRRSAGRHAGTPDPDGDEGPRRQGGPAVDRIWWDQQLVRRILPRRPSPTSPACSFSANGSGWPPDTNGDVGPNHYIQTVNTSVGIYNKTTGAAISTVTFNTFFTGPAGTPCDTSNDGDPVVLYDPAGRSLDRHRLRLVRYEHRSLLRMYRSLPDRRPGGRRLVLLRHAGQHRHFRRRLLQRLSQAGRVAGWLLHVGQHVRGRGRPASACACGASTRPRC